MSTNQLSIEKKTNVFKITSFAFLQVSILLFAPSLGLWIVRLMRANELATQPIVMLFQNLAIGFTFAFVIALIVTLITYFIYCKYRKQLDTIIDSSISNMKKNNVQDTKPKININLNQTPASPQKSVVQINAKPTNNGPIKKVVTTTTTRPNIPPTSKAVGGVGSPRPGMPPIGPSRRPVGIAPRPGMPPMGPRRTVGIAPRPGMSPMGPRPGGVPPRPGVGPIKK